MKAELYMQIIWPRKDFLRGFLSAVLHIKRRKVRWNRLQCSSLVSGKSSWFLWCLTEPSTEADGWLELELHSVAAVLITEICRSELPQMRSRSRLALQKETFGLTLCNHISSSKAIFLLPCTPNPHIVDFLRAQLLRHVCLLRVPCTLVLV